MRVVVTWPDYDFMGAEQGLLLRDAGFELVEAAKRGARAPDAVARLMAGAAGCIVSTDPFPAPVLAVLPDLRVIARVGVGTDSIDLDAATRHGVAVTITPGANSDVVADHALAMLLAACRRLLRFDASVRAGRWERTGAHSGHDVSGRTIGIVGAGTIGRGVLARLAGFPVTRLWYDPLRDDPIEGCERVATPEALFERADAVSLHAPLNGATRGMVGAALLERLGPKGILVNTARGGIVDEAALLDALEHGRILAAALDVFADEPPHASPLLARDDVLVSPHAAALSAGSIAKMTAMASRGVLARLTGGQVEHVVNPRALER